MAAMVSQMAMFGDDSDSEEEENQFNTKIMGPASLHKDGSIPTPIEQMVEVKEVAYAGGQRGVFATCDLPAGFLVLAEVPTMAWNVGDLNDLENMSNALNVVCGDADTLEVTRYLHPRSLQDADLDEVDRATTSLEPDGVLSRLAADSGLPAEEVVRVLLVLQHNGFESGLYKHLSMVNHSCDPNCMKYSPTHSSGGASQIWTSRPVAAGEELSICYCTPLERTQHSMLDFLEVHHRFSCACRKCQYINDQAIEAARIQAQPVADAQTIEELATALATAASPSSNALTNIHKYTSMDAIQKDIEDIERELIWQKIENLRENLKIYPAMLLKLEMLLNKVLQLSSERGDDVSTTGSFPDDRVRILARTHQCSALVARNCIEALDKLSSSGGAIDNIHLKSKYTKPAAAGNGDGDDAPPKSLLLFATENFNRSSIELLKLQLLYLGRTHPDLATTCIDIGEGLETFLRISAPASTSNAAPDLIGTGTVHNMGQYFMNELQQELLQGLDDFLAGSSSCNSSSSSDTTHSLSPANLSNPELFTRKYIKAVVAKCFKEEGEQLKKMYSTHARYPNYHKLGRAPGVVYWGSELPTPII